MSVPMVALADEHPLMLRGICDLLDEHGRYTVVGATTSGGQVLGLAREHQPNIFIVDLSLKPDALELIPAILAASKSTKVLVLAASSVLDGAVRAFEAGASGYALRSSSGEELLMAIDAVLQGSTFINPSFAAQVVAALRDSAIRRVAAQNARLSVREHQIIQLLLYGSTNKEIADKLAISEKTVKHYMTAVMQKLSARNRLEVVLAAQKLDGFYHSDTAH